MLVDFFKWVHVIGASVLLGRGAGIAFFMLMAHRTGSPVLVAHVAGTVVLADTLFTVTAVVAQPITGLLPTNQWRQGDYVVDTHTLPISTVETAKINHYEIVVYNADTGQTLGPPITINNEQ